MAPELPSPGYGNSDQEEVNVGNETGFMAAEI
jgi:hypothetical protein